MADRKRRQPTEQERDERVKLDLPLTLEEEARVLVAVKPEHLPSDEGEREASS